ncbi:MAG TPA: hypothetical protein VGF55_28365, partial [Gemmataceae bacterium]
FDTTFGPQPGGPRFGPPGFPARPSDQAVRRAMKRIEGVLTADQQAAWKELVGEPFVAPRPGSQARPR